MLVTRLAPAIQERDREAGWTALAPGCAITAAIGPWSPSGPSLLRAFSSDPRVVAIGTGLLAIAGAFQLFDGTQAVATGALRGISETRTPMAPTSSEPVLGFPAGYPLCFPLGWGVSGLWIGLSIGLVVAAGGADGGVVEEISHAWDAVCRMQNAGTERRSPSSVDHVRVRDYAERQSLSLLLHPVFHGAVAAARAEARLPARCVRRFNGTTPAPRNTSPIGGCRSSTRTASHGRRSSPASPGTRRQWRRPRRGTRDGSSASSWSIRQPNRPPTASRTPSRHSGCESRACSRRCITCLSQTLVSNASSRQSPPDPGTAVFVHCGVLSVGVRKKLGLPSRFDLSLGDPLSITRLALAFPQLPFIVPHFGAGMLRETMMAADACPNIHVDTSSTNNWIRYAPGWTLPGVFKTAMSVLGPSRLLFGTDSSFFPRGWQRAIYESQKAAATEAGIPERDQALIFGGNFDRLFPQAGE